MKTRWKYVFYFVGTSLAGYSIGLLAWVFWFGPITVDMSHIYAIFSLIGPISLIGLIEGRRIEFREKFSELLNELYGSDAVSKSVKKEN